MSSLIVIDNFYPSPKSILKKVSQMDFVEPEDADGWRTSEGYFPDNITALLESKTGFNITELDRPQGTPHDNGTFFHAFAKGKKKETPGVHWDLPLNHHVCIVYLTENIPSRYGTSFYKHKATGLECAPIWRDAKRLNTTTDALRKWIDKECRNKKYFEETDRVGYLFNRAVIFPAKRLHAATNHFGSNINDGRIYQIFSFKVEQN